MASFGTGGRFGGSVPPPKGLGSGRRLTKLEIKQVRNKLKAAAYSSGGVDWHRLFKHYDRNNTGELNLIQFKRALRSDAKISVSILPDNSVRHLFNTIDLDGGGSIDVDEFIAWVDSAGDSDDSRRPFDGETSSTRFTRKSSGYGRRSPTEMSSPSQRRFHFGQGRWLNNNDENSSAEGVQFRQESQESHGEASASEAMFDAQLALERELAATPKLVSVPKRRTDQDENERIIKSQADQLAVLKLIVEQQYEALSPAPAKLSRPGDHAITSDVQQPASDLTREKGQSKSPPAQSSSSTYTVRCHCGAMRGEFKCTKVQITCWDCNCSDCSMRRNLHFIIPAKAFRTTTDFERVSTLYCWGTGVAQRRFCKTCGILPWYVPRSNPNGIGITLDCVDWGSGERPGIVIKRYDGLNWERSHSETGIASESEYDEDDAVDVLI